MPQVRLDEVAPYETAINRECETMNRDKTYIKRLRYAIVRGTGECRRRSVLWSVRGSVSSGIVKFNWNNRVSMVCSCYGRLGWLLCELWRMMSEMDEKR